MRKMGTLGGLSATGGGGKVAGTAALPCWDLELQPGRDSCCKALEPEGIKRELEETYLYIL